MTGVMAAVEGFERADFAAKKKRRRSRDRCGCRESITRRQRESTPVLAAVKPHCSGYSSSVAAKEKEERKKEKPRKS